MGIFWPGFYVMIYGIGAMVGGLCFFLGLFSRTSALFFVILSMILLDHAYFSLNQGLDWL